MNQQWLQKQIDSGFSDFKGLNVTATIPVRDTLVNELIADALSNPPGDSKRTGFDFRPYLRFVKKAEVHASEGVLALDVVIKID
jgi:hypothetical protein